MRNKGLILLSAFLFFFVFYLNIDAATAGTTTTSVNIRKSPTTASAKVVTLAKGKAVSLYNTTKYKGAGCSAGWYKMSYGGAYRYICSSYVKISKPAAKVVGTASGTTTTSVNIRSGAGTGYAKVATIAKNKAVSLVGTSKYKGSGCAAGWYKVAYGGYARYICSSYVKVKTVAKTTTTTAKVVGTTTGTTTSAINLRSTYSTSGKIVTTIASEKTLSLVGTTKYTGAGCAAGWYKVAYNGTAAYACSSYVKLPSSSSSTTTTTTGKQLDGYINGTAVNVRTGAGTGYSLVGEYEFGTQVKLLSTTKKEGTGCGAGWYNIQFTVNKTTKSGYICSDYIYKYADIKATDTAYTTTLKNAGFPDSYIPYLTKLHKLHSNWTFVAEKNNLDWNSAVSYESMGSTSLLQTNFSSYRASNTVYDGSNWYAANKNVVAVYLDPRNFLTEKHIFMFESLGYNANTANATVLNAMFGSGSYLKNYTSTFLSAASTNKISARALAARAISETGKNGGYATNGTYTFKCNGVSYKGYYNIFNIGAYAGTNAVQTGLCYAAGKNGNTSYGVPWNTLAKSINGGAQFLYGQYVAKGQDTAYYQKFNVSKNRYYNAYTNQYMQNIKAPTAEAGDTYSTLKSNNLLGYGYTFKIPVFNSMPAYTVLP